MAIELRVPLIIWAAQFMATFMFVGVELVLRSEGNVASPGGGPTLLMVLGLAALSSAVMSFVLPRQLQRQALANLKLETQEQVVEDEPQLFRKAPKTAVVFSDPKRARSAASRSRRSLSSRGSCWRCSSRPRSASSRRSKASKAPCFRRPCEPAHFRMRRVPVN
jgi:hypothetical protein